MRERQRAKIKQFGDALAATGLRTLDKQADALALSRSTTWNLLKGKHKGSGISPTIINRMLASPRLPPRVRATILEYVAEKATGAYGDSRARLDRFTAQLSGNALADAWPVAIEQRKRPHKARPQVTDACLSSSLTLGALVIFHRNVLARMVGHQRRDRAFARSAFAHPERS
jgi:hypothetical protein